MAWEPVDNATLAEVLVQQLFGIVKRDMQPALDYFYPPAGTYEDFQAYELADSPLRNPPSLLITPQTVTFDEEANYVAKHSDRLFVQVTLAHQNPNVVAERVERYARALRAVIRTAFVATSTDFNANDLALPNGLFENMAVTQGLPVGVLKKVFVSDIAFSSLRESGSRFVKAAAMTIEADLIEE